MGSRVEGGIGSEDSNELPERVFVLYTQPTPGTKVAVAMSGPLQWLVALIAVAVVVDRFDAAGIALVILAGSFVVALGRAGADAPPCSS